MSGLPPPLRFLALVVGGWACARALVLAPDWWTDTAVADVRHEAERSRPAAMVPAVDALPPVPSRPRAAAIAAPMVVLHRSTAIFSAPPKTQPVSIPLLRLASSAPIPLILPPLAPDTRSTSTTSAAPAPLPFANRWSGSAWLFGRNGDSASLASGGALGGSQAGARLLYRLGGGLSLSGRLYSPLESRHGAEAALGLEWQPSRSLPLRILAERREALGRDGRSAFALLAHGGVSDRPVAGPLHLDAYAQAGVVGLARRDAFADGAVRLSLPLGRDLAAGAGAWGAVQPGVSRLDVGPSITLRGRLGDAGMRLSADWRFRIAGDAAPGSGPALTVATDF